MRVEVVSHCWNYARLLGFQLSSLVLHPPEFPVTMTVWWCAKDERTEQVLHWYIDNHPAPPNVSWTFRAIKRKQLMRRSIGRNVSAHETDADWVWFADCDMAFRGTFGAQFVRAVDGVTRSLCYPRHSLVNQGAASSTRALMDATAEDTLTDPVLGLIDVRRDDYKRRTNPRAIGGIQIVRGNVARESGYLPNSSRYQRPANSWQRTFEDTRYRKSLRCGNGAKVDLPGVYRIRHAVQGRFHEGCYL